MPKDSDENLDFIKYIVEHNHRTAEYYEDKKYKIMFFAASILGLDVTLISLVTSKFLLSLGAAISLIFSFLALVYYALSSMPEYKPQMQNIDYDSIKKLSKDDILKQYIQNATSLQNSYMSKRNAVKIMNILMLIGLFGFAVCTVTYFIGSI